MVIIVRKHNPKNTRFDQLRGTGLLPVPNAICELPKCKPEPLTVPKSPKPKTSFRPAPTPLCARKSSKKDNKWSLRGITYPNFNSLWINIPQKRFTVLKVPNGKG